MFLCHQSNNYCDIDVNGYIVQHWITRPIIDWDDATDVLTEKEREQR